MSNKNEQVPVINNLRSQRQEADTALYNNQIALQKITTIVKKQREEGSEEIGETEQEKIKLEGDVKKNKSTLDGIRAELHNAIESIYVNQHPRDPIAKLGDDIPFLLMPVRIETRFINTGRSDELWLRIYPDDIAIHTHESLLTDKEVVEGEKYWKAIFLAEKNGGTEKESLKKTAWVTIRTVFGPQRSAWIAKQTQPSNWKDLAILNNVSQLIFPVHNLTKTGAWSRAPRTHIMPDRFVVMLYTGETIAHEVTGRIIPDELFVGPDPLEPGDAFIKKDEKLVFGESYDWTSNFDKAVQMGMGFKIPLTKKQATDGFDKILALGAYLSADETGTQKAVETLIDNHHYSPKGFSIVTQGTPTNNTDEEGSGYTKNDQFSNTSYFVETGDVMFDETDDCDGRNLADALGIEYTPLQYIMNSNATDYKEAVAMNKALYPATLGYYFDTMMKPVLSEATQDRLRDFYVQHVTGRGWIPAIRVGNQPYGILLTSNYSAWKWNEKEPGFSSSFLNPLTNILNHYHATWKSLLDQVQHVGKKNTDPSQVLMNVLGLQAGSVSIGQRVGYSSDDMLNRDEFQFGGQYFTDLAKTFNSKVLLFEWLRKFGYAAKDNEVLQVPQQLRLIFQHYHTLLDAANLVGDIPGNYIHWLAETTTLQALEQQNFGAGIKPPSALLYMQLRRALLLQLHKSTVNWFNKYGIALHQTIAPVNFHNIRPQATVTKWEVMKAKVENAVPQHAQKNIAAGEYLLTVGQNENEAAFLNSMRESLNMLANTSTANLERCLTEHLDTCTYRLDAWQTALFNIRLQKQRQIQNNNPRSDRKKGIYAGAYGWVENIRPASKRTVVKDEVPEKLRPANNAPLFEYADNGGFVHAPSLNHASAAAILRSGYLSHANSTDPDLMSVNLSSERIRRALFVLQGIRNGQTLEALLGYQFERGLHDRASQNTALVKLNLYIYDFRDAFPIEQHQVLQQGTNTTTEAIPANNVVNGLTLAEKTSAFPFGATGPVVSATTDERNAIIAEKNRLADTLDAMKDLLLSESVYQLVQGNFDRSGAVINALKDFNIPPELDVINTPRGSHFTFTNRVTVQFANLDPAIAANNPWSPVAMTPRAKIETGINHWLKSILGDATKLVCRVSHADDQDNELGFEEMSIDKLKIQPIDLIYIAGNELNTGENQDNKESNTSVSELESRIAFYYRKANTLADDIPVRIEFMKPENAAGRNTLGVLLPLLRMLKSLITDSRSLHAEDFDPPSKKSAGNPNNPKGYDAGDMLTRVEATKTIYQNNLNSLHNVVIDAAVDDGDGLITICTNLLQTFDALDAAKMNLAEIAFTFTNAAALQLQGILADISLLGVADSFPQVATATSDDKKLILLEQARNTARKMKVALTRAGKQITDAAAITVVENKVSKLLEAGKTLLGDVFNILPRFTYNNEADILQSNGDRAQLLKHATNQLKMNFAADEWMQNASHVRPRLSRWEYIRTLHETYNGDSLELKPVQLPYRIKDSWIAVEFPDKDELNPTESFNITHDTISVTIHGDAAFTAAARHSGLLIDDWTEMIPTKEEVTGISFNYNQPNAAPPQTLLLAIPPEEKGTWSWDILVGIVNDTLLRAKLRAVEPQLLDTLNKPELGVLLPALMANFTQYDLDISLDYRLNVAYYVANAPVMAVMKSN